MTPASVQSGIKRSSLVLGAGQDFQETELVWGYRASIVFATQDGTYICRMSQARTITYNLHGNLAFTAALIIDLSFRRKE